MGTGLRLKIYWKLYPGKENLI